MPDVLLATCAELPAGDEDADLLSAALERAGLSSEWAIWDDPAVDWSASLVVLRSTWDYTADQARFLAWVEGLPHVANSAGLARWSSDKTYLRDLGRAGVPIVETTFAAPAEPIAWPAHDEVVVKPSVGAGSRGAGRFTRDRRTAAIEHAAALHRAGRTVLIQPYLSGVDADGETALIYVEGVFTHAIRKGPMLPDAIVHPIAGRELYVAERTESRTPSAAERELADSVLACVRDRFHETPLYARVDLLPSPSGPAVVELELVEPSLFLAHAETAAGLLARAIARRVPSAVRR